VLTLCLILSSSANSQALSIDTQCCVPCNTLKKALLVKTEKDYLKNQIGVVRDSVSILNVIVSQQDTLLKSKDSQIELYKKNEVNYLQIVDNKNKQIELYNKELKATKKSIKTAYGVAILSIFSSILIAL
jgi:hypothetical protein